MKRTILSVAFALGLVSVNAQDLTSKKGEPYLPEADDMAICADAAPFLNYAGNMLSSGGNTAPTVGYNNGNFMIMVKKFKDQNNAMRAKVRLGLHSSTQKQNIADVTVTTLPTFPAMPAMKEDKGTFKSTFFGIGAGIEKRRGKTRLQGYYGGEGMLALMSGKAKFEYGNSFDATYMTTANASNTSNIAGTIGTGSTSVSSLAPVNNYYPGGRIITAKQGLGFGIGARGFIGAEYFIFPKMSIGGEFGWGLGFVKTGKYKETTEVWGGAAPGSVAEIEYESPGTTRFGLDTDINNALFGAGTAQLTLNLHF